MGNLNCCAQQGQIDTGLEKPTVETFTTTTANPDHKLHSANEEIVEEQVQEQIKAEAKFQNTAFPDVSITDAIKHRIHDFQPALNACLKEIDTLISLVALVYDPTEQLIAIKQLSLTLSNNLNNLNLYWIAIYETHNKKETPQFLQSLEHELIALREFLVNIQKKATDYISKNPTENVTEHNLFKQYLNEDENVKKIEQDFLKDLVTKQNQFQQYSSVRRMFENKFILRQGDMQIENAEQELTSLLPAYIRLNFRSQQGFQVWNELFHSQVDVCKDLFIALFSKKCEITDEQIKFIVLQINSGLNTISFFEFMHFIKENAIYFDQEGVLLKDKHSEIEKLVSDLISQVTSESKLVSENNYEYPNGCKFTGTLVDGLRSGHGKDTKFGINFEGSFLKGVYQGAGTLTYPDGTMYNGNFNNNQYHGQGELSDFNGVVYSGEWKEGKLSNGSIIYSNGLTYKGDIEYNRFRHGKGTLTNALKQVVFEGSFTHDELADGVLNLNGAVLYKGTFSQTDVSKGVFHYQDGTYEGQINTVTYSREGQGHLLWLQKQKLEGEWKNDAPINATNFFDIENTNSKYVGQWNNFNRHGKGEFYYASGAKFTGDISSNLRAGQGKYTFANGNIYEGQWSQNDFNGIGTFTFQNEDVFKGSFQNGKFHGFGKYLYKNKRYYEGEWANDKWNGKGKYVEASGNILKEGQWESDKLIKSEKVTFDAPIQQQVPVVKQQQNPEEQQEQQTVAKQPVVENQAQQATTN